MCKQNITFSSLSIDNKTQLQLLIENSDHMKASNSLNNRIFVIIFQKINAG
jgi:hypothetical protein